MLGKQQMTSCWPSTWLRPLAPKIRLGVLFPLAANVLPPVASGTLPPAPVVAFVRMEVIAPVTPTNAILPPSTPLLLLSIRASLGKMAGVFAPTTCMFRLEPRTHLPTTFPSAARHPPCPPLMLQRKVLLVHRVIPTKIAPPAQLHPSVCGTPATRRASTRVRKIRCGMVLVAL